LAVDLVLMAEPTQETVPVEAGVQVQSGLRQRVILERQAGLANQVLLQAQP
jgi:hypothetical protein